MRRIVALFLALAVGGGSAAAQTQPDRIDAFEQAYAASFYTFDACGDGVAGRIYRSAVVARFAQCPFTDAARTRFRQRTALQRKRSSEQIGKTIAEHDGVPLRLEGMRMTCHEQRSSAEYRATRERLEQYEAGQAASDAVIPEPCGAATFSPYR